MIQRKQTIFLFLAAALMFVTYLVPLANFIGEDNSLILTIFGVKSIVPGFESPVGVYFTLPLLTIVTTIILLSIIAIFMFKKRRIQLLLVRFMLLLLLSYIGLYFFYYSDTLENISGGLASYEYGIKIPGSGMQIPVVIFLLPLVAALLLFLASRGIIHDEKLIKSADRLR